MRANRCGAAIAAACAGLVWIGPALEGLSVPPDGHAASRLSADLDRTCAPCRDFFRFANGGWIDAHPAPPQRPTWGRFYELVGRHEEGLRELLESASASNAAAGSLDQKLGDFYAACMDSSRDRAVSSGRFGEHLRRLAGITSRAQLEEAIARLQRVGVAAPFTMAIVADDQDPTVFIATATQDGISLPDRSHYVGQEAPVVEIRRDYRAHVVRMMTLGGSTTAAADADAVLEIETGLATASVDRATQRDPAGNYHKLTREALRTLTPHFSWDRYFHALGAAEAQAINVRQPAFFSALDRLIDETPVEKWQAYLRWRLVHGFAEDLAPPLAAEHQQFFSGRLLGTTAADPAWKVCVRNTDRYLGEALGHKYVAERFAGIAVRARTIVDDLQRSLRERLEQVAWMSAPTRRTALAKLDALSIEVGAPSTWDDYAGFAVRRDDPLANVYDGRQHEMARQLDRLGKTVSRTAWDVTPHTLNANYNVTANQIVLPAAIFQPPFFDPQASDAMNYGAIGSLVGHELTHAFDDEGRHYDAAGRLRNWWLADDEAAFNARAACVQRQFDGFVGVGDLHVNGKLVLGEALADLGGLSLAHAAFERASRRQPLPGMDGFTADQLFFLGWGRLWAGVATPEYERLTLLRDPHPPFRFRAQGPLAHLPAFRAAFSCSAGDAMVREADRCALW
jgi:predicted metalloendopeptidase